MYKKRFSLPMSIINFLVCLLVLSLLYEDDNYVKAQTPQAFLNPIYYGSTTVNAVFDHNLPLLSLERFDDPDCVQHNDGSSCLENPPYGLGYDRHDGIDYGLKYKPILPAANGIVVEAGWR